MSRATRSYAAGNNAMRGLRLWTLRAGKSLPGLRRCQLLSCVVLAGSFLAPGPAESMKSTLASPHIAQTILERQPDLQLTTGSQQFRGEDPGLLLEGMQAAWYNSANGEYFRYEKKAVDAYLKASEGKADEDAVDTWEGGLIGKQLLLMHEVTRDRKYYEAASAMRMWLGASCAFDSGAPGAEHAEDKVAMAPCMAESFLAAYASAFQRKQDFAAITEQFVRWRERVHRSRSAKNDLASPEGEPLMRARLLVSLVDALSCYPHEETGRTRLIETLRSEVELSEHTGYAVGELYAPMYVYAILKGVRLGYLPANDSSFAERVWQGGEKQQTQSDRYNGPLLLASTEIDLAGQAKLGHGQTLLLDAWFNSQQRKNAVGEMEYFHYKWQDYGDSGYSLLGHLFESYGMAADTLYSAPTQENLGKAQYYLIASPDIPVKNPNPHYMTEHDAEEIAAWVRQGGVLILLENDPPNADITHLNLLADKFGIHFDDVLHHHILNDPEHGDHVEDGTVPVKGGGPLFHDSHTLYMKDTCAITLHEPAVALLQDRGDVMMATAKYGKGMVFAAVDPWVYNEYADGRKNPAVYNQFDNFAGAKEVVQWLLEQRISLGMTAKKPGL